MSIRRPLSLSYQHDSLNFYPFTLTDKHDGRTQKNQRKKTGLLLLFCR